MSIDFISGNVNLEEKYFKNYSTSEDTYYVITKILSLNNDVKLPHPVSKNEDNYAYTLSYHYNDKKSIQGLVRHDPDLVVFEYTSYVSVTDPKLWTDFTVTGHDVLVSLPFRSLDDISQFIIQNVQQEKTLDNLIGNFYDHINSVEVFDGLYSRTFLPTDNTRQLLRENGTVSEVSHSFAEKIK